MIRFASDRVSPSGIQPEIVLALVLVAPLFEEYRESCLITSLTDGRHRVGSLHYRGLAVDLRSRDVTPVDKTALLEDMRDVLPPYYEVYLEDPGGLNEHFHIEYDFKGRETTA